MTAVTLQVKEISSGWTGPLLLLLEARDLDLHRVHITADQQLAEAPHVAVQRQ